MISGGFPPAKLVGQLESDAKASVKTKLLRSAAASWEKYLMSIFITATVKQTAKLPKQREDSLSNLRLLAFSRLRLVYGHC